MINKNIKDLIKDKSKDIEKYNETIEIYEFIEHFGLKFLETEYLDANIKAKINFLEELGLLEDLKENTDKTVDFLKEFSLINIEWIRYFIIFAEMGNIVKAAEFLNITPQALNKAITSIEEQMQLRLVKRKYHIKSLTFTGYLFFKKSKTIMKDFFSINKSVNEFKTDSLAKSITLVYPLYNILLTEAVSQYSIRILQNFPDTFVSSYTVNFEDLEELIESGEADIGITTVKPVNINLDYKVFYKMNYVIVSKPAKKKKWNELEYIVNKPWKSTVKNLEIWNDEKYPRKIKAEVDHLVLSVKLSEEGLGSILVIENLVRKKINEKKLCIIADTPEPYSRDLYIIWNKRNYNTHFLSKIIKLILNTDLDALTEFPDL
jgi:LysR family transcriptional repressor of citA